MRPIPCLSLHLRSTHSLEYFYVNEGLTRDAHIDLALLKWGCQSLLQICERLKIQDPLIPKWQHVLQRLTDFPVDEYGFMVGRDIPFRHEHRHLAHLMAIYPLQLVHWEQPDNRDLIKLSLAKSTRDRHAGDYLNFTAAWAACMYANIGMVMGSNPVFVFFCTGQCVTLWPWHEHYASSFRERSTTP